MKSLCWLILTAAVCSCNTTKNLIADKPVLYTTDRGLVVHSLLLKTDSTFEYRITGDLMNSRSEGMWRMDKSNLILNSFPSYYSGTCLISDHPSSKKIGRDSTYVQIKDDKSLPLSSAELMIGDRNWVANGMGEIQFPSALKDTVVKVKFLNEQYSCFDRSLAKSDKLIIIKLRDRSSIYFDNEILIIKGSRLSGTQMPELRRRKSKG
jgi:hypothetical protein